MLLIIALCIPLCNAQALSVSATAAVLYHPDTGEVLYSRNMNKTMTMASTTKIMTGLILCETGNLDKIVNVTDKMIYIEGTSIGLRKGDKISRLCLLYGLLLESGNDAANAIAIDVAGTTERFAQLMNKKAAEIGMTGTNFVTPSGLDAKEHYTTAYDMALLSAAAMKNEMFSKVVGTKSYKAVYNEGNTYRTYSNHNRLLNSLEGADGIKTGFTKKSGRCLVSSCTKDGLQLIAVTLNAPDDWNDHKALYNYGFGEYEKVTLGGRFTVKPVLVAGGTKSSVAVKNDAISLYMKKGTAAKVTYVIELPAFVYAPVNVGDTIGQVKFLCDNKVIATSPFTATEKSDIILAEQENLLDRIINWFLILISIK